MTHTCNPHTKTRMHPCMLTINQALSLTRISSNQASSEKYPTCIPTAYISLRNVINNCVRTFQKSRQKLGDTGQWSVCLANMAWIQPTSHLKKIFSYTHFCSKQQGFCHECCTLCLCLSLSAYVDLRYSSDRVSILPFLLLRTTLSSALSLFPNGQSPLVYYTVCARYLRSLYVASHVTTVFKRKTDMNAVACFTQSAAPRDQVYKTAM